MCSLDFSKTLMYKCYKIDTDNVYTDFYVDNEKFDNSDYPLNHVYYYNNNKEVVGKIKDETAGVSASEFIGLSSKMYSNILDNGKNGKGIKWLLSRRTYSTMITRLLFWQQSR